MLRILRLYSAPPALLMLMLLTLLASGCRRERPRELLPTPLRLTPVDSAPEGELGEGKHSAFGLILPRGMIITANMGDTIYARGLVGYEAAIRYLRAHAIAESEEQSKTKLVMKNAKLAHRPEDKVHIEVSTAGGKVEMVVRDRRRKPAEPGLSVEERYRRVGLTPDGRVLENQAR